MRIDFIWNSYYLLNICIVLYLYTSLHDSYFILKKQTIANVKNIEIKDLNEINGFFFE